MPAPLFANDTSVGGTGVDLHILKESSVRMQAEDITLTHVERVFEIVAKYTFENPTDNHVQLQVGFPEVGCLKEEEGDCHAGAFRGLETTVDGKIVVHRKGSLKQTEKWAKHLGTFWLFDVDFPAKKKVVIFHRYSMDATLDSMGGVSVSYVTRTGATWAKPIGHAKFRFRVPPYATHLMSNEVLGAPQNPRFVKEGAEAFTEVVFEKKNWIPKGDLFFSFATAFGQFPVPRLDPGTLSKRAQDLGLRAADQCPWTSPYGGDEPATSAQAQSCRNLIYARWGYPFEKRRLRDLYYIAGKKWHVSHEYGPNSLVRDPEPLPEFSLAWTSAAERRMLQEIPFKSNVMSQPPAASPAPSARPQSGPPGTAKTPRGAPNATKQSAPPAARVKAGCSFAPAMSCPKTGNIILLLAALLVLRFTRRRTLLRASLGIAGP